MPGNASSRAACHKSFLTYVMTLYSVVVLYFISDGTAYTTALACVCTHLRVPPPKTMPSRVYVMYPQVPRLKPDPSASFGAPFITSHPSELWWYNDLFNFSFFFSRLNWLSQYKKTLSNHVVQPPFPMFLPNHHPFPPVIVSRINQNYNSNYRTTETHHII